MNTVRNSLWLLSILSILTQCMPGSKNTAHETVNATNAPHQVSSNVQPWPKPSQYAEGIPVYEHFSQLEPFFHFQNDTTYLINFWATWCAPCVKELPYFEALTEKYANQPVRVILVSLDFPNQMETKLVPFVAKHELKSKVIALLDGSYNDWIDQVSTEWSGTIPATLLYKNDRQQFIGQPVESLEELESILTRL